MYDYGGLFNSKFIQFEYSTKEKIVEYINKIIKSNVSIDELLAFIEYYKENVMDFEEASKEFGGYGGTKFDDDTYFDLVPPEIRKEIIGKDKTKYKLLPINRLTTVYLNINKKKLKEQYDKKYSPSKGKKYVKDNNLEFKVDKTKKEKEKEKEKDKTKSKKKLNLKPFRMELKEKGGDITEEEVENLEKIFDYDKKKLFEEFDFKWNPELKGLLI